nr:reverse transcriptase domain-containing protein [Tanacetum cinerariifolium]
MHNEDLRTELKYFSEDYDEEREMEPRPESHREATPTLQLRSSGFADNEKELRDSRTHQTGKETGGEGMPKVLGLRRLKQGKPMHAPPNMPSFPNPAGSFADFAGSVTPFVCWIEDYPLPNGLTMPSHIGSYDGKGGLDNFWKEKKTFDIPRGESRKDKGKAHSETPILMVSQGAHIVKSLIQENIDYEGKEIIFPPVARANNARVIIEAKIFRRKVGRVHMDGESSYEIIYEICFEKLNPTIKATKVDLKTPLVGFSGERSWSVGEVSLDITIGDTPFSRTENVNFVIVRSDSPHNMQLGRTTMQRMGIVVSMIHGSIKIHIEKGIELYFRQTKPIKERKGQKDTCHKKKLPDHFKKDLQNLLKSNADVFAWTHTDMKRILRTIMIEGKPFNTKLKLNECSHIKHIKQNKRGATYQRLIDKVFSHQIGRNLEAYVDDMAIKSTSKIEILKDIQETFERFRSINMKLNPKKCSFGVEEGPFLGHLINKHGIKANPSKVKAVIDLDQPRTLKYIQSLNGKLAALSRFLSKGAERSLAFFKVLKGCKDKNSIQWTTEADKALEKIKKLILTLPTLIAPRVGETLTMYLAASKESISVVLAVKRNKGWTLIYFVSKVLQGAEFNYPTDWLLFTHF